MKKQKKETSKIVLEWVLKTCLMFAIAVFVGWFLGLDGAPELAGVISGIALAVIGFYTWKAKNENIMKYGKGAEDDDY